jgi:hypothetical protein
MINHVMASLRPAARKGGTILSSIALAALALSSASCSSTKVVSFTNAGAPSKVPVNSVVTVMADPRGELRAAVEDHLTRQLESNGVKAYSSYTKISTEVLQGDRNIARDALADWGADAVLVCRLTDRTDISEPPSFKSNVADWKQAWGTESLQSTEFEADTWGGEVTVTIHMESKLYRLSTAELLWVGHAETKLGETTDEVKRIQSVSKKLVSQLEKDGWIK